MIVLILKDITRWWKIYLFHGYL